MPDEKKRIFLLNNQVSSSSERVIVIECRRCRRLANRSTARKIKIFNFKNILIDVTSVSIFMQELED